MGDYSTRISAQTPVRTPRTENRIMKEAQHALAFQNAQTPLEGGENADVQGADFSGLTPQSKVEKTPNILTTGGQPQSSAVFKTPGAMTPGGFRTPFNTKTPVRDAMGLNEMPGEWDDSTIQTPSSVTNSVAMQKARLENQKMQVKSRLRSLPTPQNEYELEVPEMEEEKEDVEMIKDAEELLEIEKLKQDEKKYLIEMQKTSAVRRDLPRPFIVSSNIFKFSSVAPDAKDEDNQKSEQRQEIEKMIQDEIMILLMNDAKDYPQKGAKEIKYAGHKEVFDVQEIEEADKLLNEEIDNIKQSLKHGELSVQAIGTIWEEKYENLQYFPSIKRYDNFPNAPKAKKLESIQKNFELARATISRDQKKLSKLEQKVKVLTTGYQKVSDINDAAMDELIDKHDKLTIQLDVYRHL
eukprot:CAMPEP_0115041436 /NCGR_PEP_ID=MMETSP0216-20121206/45520_1 /TAXON_ID=223996 /ORGANISM="Protocruzia adherens, Strain Boccale" /LENGTH=409 /DNA_ID=CAMNT_0002423061 /DNA_START=1 /DNA_END=1226 /DNA_ORIENTATION=-